MIKTAFFWTLFFVVVFPVKTTFSKGHSFYKKPDYKTFLSNGYISNVTRKNHWDKKRNLLVLDIEAVVKRNWKEVNKYIDPIHWGNCSGYFRGSKINKIGNSPYLAGKSWEGELELNENIYRDIRDIPNGSPWYLKWHDHRHIHANSIFKIRTDLDKSEKSYTVNYAVLDNRTGFVRLYSKGIALLTFNIDGQMVKNDGYITSKKIDKNKTFVRVYKEIKFSGKDTSKELKANGVPLLGPVLTEMLVNWLTCQGF